MASINALQPSIFTDMIWLNFSQDLSATNFESSRPAPCTIPVIDPHSFRTAVNTFDTDLEFVTSHASYNARLPVAWISSIVLCISKLLIFWFHSLSHSTMVTLPDSLSAIISSRRFIFRFCKASSSSCNHCSILASSFVRPRRINVAPAFRLDSATPTIHLAVTPAPPPDTTQTSSDCND